MHTDYAVVKKATLQIPENNHVKFKYTENDILENA